MCIAKVIFCDAQIVLHKSLVLVPSKALRSRYSHHGLQKQIASQICIARFGELRILGLLEGDSVTAHELVMGGSADRDLWQLCDIPGKRELTACVPPCNQIISRMSPLNVFFVIPEGFRTLAIPSKEDFFSRSYT